MQGYGSFFLYTQFTGDTCYTSQLQIYYSGNGRMLIFETDYYTHQSRATVYDLGTLIETHMQQNGLSIEQFIISACDGTNSEELTLKVLYCKQTPTIAAETLLADCFLTTSLTRLTYLNATVLLFLYKSKFIPKKMSKITINHI